MSSFAKEFFSVNSSFHSDFKILLVRSNKAQRMLTKQELKNLTIGTATTQGCFVRVVTEA